MLKVSRQFLVYKECSCSRKILPLVSSGSFRVLLRVGSLFSQTNSSSVSFWMSSLGLSFLSLFFLILTFVASSFLLSHSSGKNRFRDRFTVFFLGNNILAALIFPSLLGISSTIFSIFQDPRDRCSFNCMMSLNLCVLVASILGDFSFSLIFLED